MSKHVFIVDDSATMVMSVRNNLEIAGYSVESARDGEEALEKLKSPSKKPDLIITDINMPKMDGLELIAQVRKLPGFRFTPILTLTTESQADRRAEGKRVGATGWLVKPVGGADLVKIIKQVVPGA